MIRIPPAVAALLGMFVGTGIAVVSTARDIDTQTATRVAPVDVDNDGDGWTVAQGDCCDAASGACTQPALVNPGAFEVPGNGVDDDCDATVDNPRAVCDAAIASNSSDPVKYAAALDVCQITTETPPIAERRWGLINAQLLLADGAGTPAANSRSIRTSFGANSPQFGNGFTVLSTGSAAAVGQTNPSYTAFQTGQSNGTTSGFPSDWFAANGSALPGLPACAPRSGPAAQDPVMLKLRMRVPTNARSFKVTTRFFGAEYPEWTCGPFDDYYLVLLDSAFAGSPPNPVDKNIGTYPNAGERYVLGTSLAVGDTGLFQACKNGQISCATGATLTTTSCVSTVDLIGTGFDIENPGANGSGYCGTNNLLGGGTAWLTTSGNVVPGETIDVRFVIWDTGDNLYDSVALLDNFQWSTHPTTPGTFLAGQTPVPPPGAFGKSGPANNAVEQPTSVTLSWDASTNAASYEYCYDTTNDNTCTAWIGAGAAQSAGLSGLSAGTTYYWHVRANGSGTTYANGSAMAFWNFTTAGGAVTFTDDPLVASVTPIKAIHVTELRQRIDALRAAHMLGAYLWTDSTLTVSSTVVRGVHVLELRQALAEVYSAAMMTPPTYTDPTLGNGTIKVAHIAEVRAAVLAIE